MVCASKKLLYQSTKSPMSTGKLRSKWGSAEMLVHLVETIEHGAEIFRANGDHRREANRRVH